MATTTSITYLLTRLRLHLGDTDDSSPRYLNSWLELALIASIETLQTWWNYKYLIDESDGVYRNYKVRFLHASPPIIERGDVRPIVLMAAIIIETGDLENLAWNVGAWRDAEISYSNIEASRRKDKLIQRDWNELTNILKPPQKNLSGAHKGHLGGYVDNQFEYEERSK